MLANSYELVGKTTSSMRAMVSKSVESIYHREILDKYTISDSLSRITKNAWEQSNFIDSVKMS